MGMAPWGERLPASRLSPRLAAAAQTPRAGAQADSLAFRGAARRVRRVMWWDSVRLWLAFGGGAAAIIFLLVLASCGVRFERC